MKLVLVASMAALLGLGVSNNSEAGGYSGVGGSVFFSEDNYAFGLSFGAPYAVHYSGPRYYAPRYYGPRYYAPPRYVYYPRAYYRPYYRGRHHDFASGYHRGSHNGRHHGHGRGHHKGHHDDHYRDRDYRRGGH